MFLQHFRLNHFLSYSKIKLSWPGALEDVWKVDYLDSYRQSVSWSIITQDAAADYLRLLYKRCNNSQTKRFSKDEQPIKSLFPQQWTTYKMTFVKFLKWEQHQAQKFDFLDVESKKFFRNNQNLKHFKAKLFMIR